MGNAPTKEGQKSGIVVVTQNETYYPRMGKTKIGVIAGSAALAIGLAFTGIQIATADSTPAPAPTVSATPIPTVEPTVEPIPEVVELAPAVEEAEPVVEPEPEPVRDMPPVIPFEQRLPSGAVPPSNGVTDQPDSTACQSSRLTWDGEKSVCL
jgi:hypothetical protein